MCRPRHLWSVWMAGLAASMVLIMFVVGRPDPPARTASAATPVTAPNPDSVREYQNQLRALEARAAQQAQQRALAENQPPPTIAGDPPAQTTQDPLADERKRRAYESLFAGNVVLSRRPAAERPDAGQEASVVQASRPERPAREDSLDRRHRRRGGPRHGTGNGRINPSPAAIPTAAAAVRATVDRSRPDAPHEPTRADPIRDAGPMHCILEGTVVDAVLTSRLDGSVAAPVNCLVTDAVYSHTGEQVLIPAGVRMLGDTNPVQAFGETRLAATFHRLVMPDGRLNLIRVNSRCKLRILCMGRKAQKNDSLPGSLDMLILRTLSLRDLHGYGIVQFIQQSSENELLVEEGSLYPALQRLELHGWIDGVWGLTSKNRRARIYKITAAGRKRLRVETRKYARLTLAIARVMGGE